MLIPRIYQNQTLQIGDEITLNSDASHHLIAVLRAKLKEKCIIFNGDGFEYQTKIINLNKKKCLVLVENKINPKTEARLNITIAQAISSNQRMDYTIQKSTELGVKNITPIISEYSKSLKWWNKQQYTKIKHWQNIAISASEQTGRVKIPKINNAVLFNDFVQTQNKVTKIILDPEANIKLNQQNLKKSCNNDIIVIIGAESGFSKQEVDMACDCGFLPFKMGIRILRTETVAPVVLAILQNILDDF